MTWLVSYSIAGGESGHLALDPLEPTIIPSPDPWRCTAQPPRPSFTLDGELVELTLSRDAVVVRTQLVLPLKPHDGLVTSAPLQLRSVAGELLYTVVLGKHYAADRPS